MDNTWPNFILLALIAVALLVRLAAWIISLTELERTAIKRDLMRGVIPAPEDIIVPRLPDGWQAVFPHGGEVFFPKAPHANPLYEIEIVGECRYHYQRAVIERADAMHRACGGRFTDTHSELKINNYALYNFQYKGKLQLEILEQDREAHRYRMMFEGDRVALSFGTACDRYLDPNLGYMRARVTVMPVGTPGIAWREEEERRRSEAKQEAHADAERFALAVKALSIRAEAFRNWADPDFRDKFARVHWDDLIQHQAEIRKEATQFLDQHGLVRFLERHNPAAVATALGRLETLLLAERVALDKAIAAAEAPKPAVQKALPSAPTARKGLTSQQVQELKVRRQQIALGDKVALALDRVATEQRIKAHVAEHYAHLEEDEQQAITQQILEEIDGEESNGKTI